MSTAKSTTDLTVQRPDYLAEEKAFGVEEMRKHIRPPRVKIVQALSDEKLITKFGVGSAIIVPALELIAKLGESFTFTPLYFFPEYCVWNPIQMKGMLPVIRERSFDLKSQVAVLARNPDKRKFPCPENTELFCNAAEHLNIVMLIHDDDGPLQDVPVVLPFHHGEHGTGSTLLSMIQMRKASICSTIFEAAPAMHQNTKGQKWQGLDFANPTDGVAWVDKDTFLRYKQLHEQFAEAHANQTIVVEHDDELGEEVETAGDSRF